MYIYSVTINIDESAEQEWLRWMENKHIPDMLATGKFFEAKMCRVMIDEDSGGITYSTQYTTESKEMLERYYTEDADKLRHETVRLFGNKFVAFRTELQVINHIKNFATS
ncbi:MAG: DUF4286 family protein [Flavobacteriaceae bacterium]|nr:DUF4286 family protein [Flavobacteriaceae bacterium]